MSHIFIQYWRLLIYVPFIVLNHTIKNMMLDKLLHNGIEFLKLLMTRESISHRCAMENENASNCENGAAFSQR